MPHHSVVLLSTAFCHEKRVVETERTDKLGKTHLAPDSGELLSPALNTPSLDAPGLQLRGTVAQVTPLDAFEERATCHALHLLGGFIVAWVGGDQSRGEGAGKESREMHLAFDTNVEDKD